MFMKQDETPCKKDCPDRSATCHIDCKKYIDWHEDRVARLKAIYKQKGLERDIDNYEVARHNKTRRRAGR